MGGSVCWGAGEAPVGAVYQTVVEGEGEVGEKLRVPARGMDKDICFVGGFTGMPLGVRV